MTISKECFPQYEYRPNFTPSEIKCVAPWFVEHRARLTEGETFFRSIQQGPETNNIAIEIDGATCTIYYNDVIVETFPATLGPGGIDLLRTTISNPITGSKYIEMPILGFDIFDNRATEDDVLIGLTSFIKTNLSGGTGGPRTLQELNKIRTGPDRTIILIATTEALNGSPTTPPPTRRVQQWDGSQWISYCNYFQGQCPGEGTC